MNLTNYSLQHRITVYVLIVLIVVMGVSAYSTLPRESFPEIEIPLILVYTVYPGVSPADVEMLITRPIETELKGLSGLKEIRSTSSEGMSTIEVEFVPEVDLDTALQKVREKVDLSKSELPSDLDDDPRVQDVDVSQMPILVINLAGDLGLARLKEIGEDLSDQLETIPGVNRVQVIGGREREVHVWVDPRRLSAFEISLTDVVLTVARENLTVPGGEIDVGRLKYLVRVPAEIERPEEIEDFIIKVHGEVPVRIRDVAAVVYGFEDETTRSRLNRNPAVTLTVEKRTGANIIAVADEVKAELERTRSALPPSVEVTLVGDMSNDIRQMVAELENNIIAGLLLVVLVLMLFLGLRNSIFVAIAIPLSMLITVSVIQAGGDTLNMVVLFSLILVVGMLVDNAVVVVENIYRHRERGADADTASRVATAEVAAPVIASTITTCVAFAPMLFWPGMMGGFMKYLPRTVIVGLVASLLVALVFNPTLCASLMSPPTEHQRDAKDGRFMRAYRRFLGWLLAAAPDHGQLGWLLRNWLLIGSFGLLLAVGLSLALGAFILEAHTEQLMGLSGLFLGAAVVAFAAQGVLWSGGSLVRRLGGMGPYVTDRRSAALWSMGAILTGTALLYGAWGRGMELFPETDPKEIWIDVEVPSGSDLDTSDAIVSRLEALTVETADMENTVANVGTLGVSVNDFGPGGSVGTRSRVTLDLVEHVDREHSSLATLEAVRSAVRGLSGAEIKVDRPEEGPPTGKPVTVRIVGDDFTRLGRLSRELQDLIRDVPGLVNLDDDFDQGKPELRVKVRRDHAAIAGVNTRDIASTIQTAIRGTEASKYRIGEDEYDIRVRLAPEWRASLVELGQLTVPDEDGIPIPMRTLAEVETGVGPAAIRRVDLRRVVTLEGDVVRAPGRTEDSVRQAVATRLDEFDWPAGYRWEFAGSNQEEIESKQFLQRAFVIAVLLITLVLVTQFNSLILPATVLVSVVLSLIGVLWGLLITGTAFGIIMTGIGVISLAGIVVNNAIVLCDFIVRLRREGLDRTAAVVEAGAIRLRPVLLTAITTILGLVPLTFGLNIDFIAGTVEYGAESSQWWGPMGVAVMAGLGVATVLTLVIVPVTYHILDESTSLLPEMLRSWWRRRGSRTAGGTVIPDGAESGSS